MSDAAMNVADNVVRIDLAARNPLQVGNCGLWDLQAFKLLLRDGVGNVPHVTLNVLLGKRLHFGSPTGLATPSMGVAGR
jgi:hypothetical protein